MKRLTIFAAIILLFIIFISLPHRSLSLKGNRVYAHISQEHNVDKEEIVGAKRIADTTKTPHPGLKYNYKVDLVGQNPRKFSVRFTGNTFEIFHEWLAGNKAIFIKDDYRPSYLVVLKSGYFKKLLGIDGE